MVTLLMREIERVERRVLGAVSFVDASTRVRVDGLLDARMDGARLQRNRSGLYVIVQADAAALAAHADAFEAAPALPAAGSVTLTLRVDDPSGRYLARSFSVALPRDPLPANAAQPDSLFRAIEVPLYPAAAAAVGANWSVLRIAVREGISGDALGGTLLIVTSGGNTLARGLSDWRGEALVAVPGVPVTTWSDAPGAVVVSEINAQVEAVFPGSGGTRTSAAQLRAGRAPSPLPRIDPEAVEAQRAALPRSVQALALAAGRSQSLSLVLALP
ncbi:MULTISPECIES: hypothetical protein [unclassified Rhizobacter]|uniref:hypothetical protein n=1 Tax=unclassified Rhizobacter TaxID=2640088 RepID=UPI0006F3FB7C|nr:MULTISPECIES: hypothetical protein [unclassified Rhizobacter]KQU77071.1 hypothetical protein ASC88_23430 [Rhizobacter sp. Root29]KQW14236.1 hypothetical protein ASC98_16470 [Rhizobacter sp. Root1238]KRB18601.1 hypothetical protein ASE08_05010 [Rhizobacter sp. Root16D2]